MWNSAKEAAGVRGIGCILVICILMLSLTACGAPRAAAPSKESPQSPVSANKAEEAPAIPPYAAAYAEILRQVQQENGTREDDPMQFVLGYIDDDDIPELLVGLTGKWDLAPVKLYTFADGKAKEMGDFGTGAAIQYSEKSGWFLSSSWHMGELQMDFYRLQEGQITPMTSLYHVDFNDNYFFKIDDVEVTKEAFAARWNELTDGMHLRDLGWSDGWEPTEENITTFTSSPAVFIRTGQYSQWDDAVRSVFE